MNREGAFVADSDDEIRRQQADIQAYLAKIRKTVAESEAMAQQIDLRLQETDRLLAAQGLTREQVMGFQFTDEQRELVNEELARRGLGRLDFAAHESFDDLTDRMRDAASARAVDMEAAGGNDAVSDRASKFRMMMQQYRVC